MATIINYTKDNLQTDHEVRYRTAQFWKGEVENGVDYVVTDHEKIAEVYEERGIPCLDKNLNPVTGQDRTSETPNEQEALPEEMTWPQLKSAASKKAGRNIMTKAEALEILQE